MLLRLTLPAGGVRLDLIMPARLGERPSGTVQRGTRGKGAIGRAVIVSDDWFRSPDFDDDALAAFEARLRRARAWNRPQLRRIKGLYVAEVGEASALRVAIDLWAAVVEDPGAGWGERAAAWEHTGNAYRGLGELELAANAYRQALATSPTRSGTSGTPDLSLAEVLIEAGGGDALTESAEILTSAQLRANLKWHREVFRYHLACARLAEAIGADAGAHARSALDVLDADRSPQLPRHKDVGRVTTDAATIEWLRAKIADGTGADQ